MDPGKTSLRVRIGVALALVLALAVALALYRPPSVVPASAPPGEFSAERALRHLAVIAASPHPTGSPRNAEVRGYLLEVLRGLDLAPRVQTAEVSASSRGRAVPGGAVHNVIATLEGAARGPAVLLVAHYDSVKGSPGASDDGAGVAALLETARALRAGPRLARDVVFLLTDGEELGLVGAQAFADRELDSIPVAVVVNIEARGSRGPSLMFETSEGNAGLIDDFVSAAPYPFASSLSSEVYRRMPNDTDFTVFRRRGIPGYNFAYIDGLRHYHTPGDSIEHLDPRSLQHHGSHALALSRRLGGSPTVPAKPGVDRDAIYFNVVGSVIAHYSSVWVWPLCVLSAALLAAALQWGVRRGRLRWRGVALGFASLLAGLFLAAAAAGLFWAAVRALDPDYTREWQTVIDLGGYRVAVTALAVLAAHRANVLARRWARPAEIHGGILVGLALLSIGSAAKVQGASYLVVWPLFAGVLALVAMTAGPANEPARPAESAVSAGRAVLLAATGAASLMLFGPTLHTMFIAVTLEAGFVVAIVVGLLTALLFPQLTLIAGRRAPER